LLHSIIEQHNSGLEFIAAPTTPTDAETLSIEALNASIKLLRPNYEYIVVDLPHDFSEVSLQALDASDLLLLVIAPELPSVRAAAAALDTYNRLGYTGEKIKIVLNNTFPRHGLTRDRIEQALNRTISVTLPYSPDILIQAINLGKPIVHQEPDEPISKIIEDFSFFISSDAHKKSRPEKPSATWKRVYDRYTQNRKR
jgi:pilus assembly protein CpaE